MIMFLRAAIVTIAAIKTEGVWRRVFVGISCQVDGMYVNGFDVFPTVHSFGVSTIG